MNRCNRERDPMLAETDARARLGLMLGDITTFPAEAIVNSANRKLIGGSGVNGAIQAAAGHGLYLECLTLGGCESGEAKLTGGHRLRARHVIHTVGPVWAGGRSGEDRILASCYRSSLTLAAEHGIRSLAFPSLSTGAYGFPLEAAARIAVREILAFLQDHDLPERVTMVCFDPETLHAYQRVLAGARSTPTGPPDYQNRNLKQLEIHGVGILEAPRPPYYSFHGTTARGLSLLDPGTPDPSVHPLWGLTTVASFPEAQGRSGHDGEVHAIYIHTGHYRPFDARKERIYQPREVEAFGIGQCGAPLRGEDLLNHLVSQHGGGTRQFLVSQGWSGICFEEHGQIHWAIWRPDCIKRTRLVSDPRQAATMEAFDPEALPCPRPDALEAEDRVKTRSEDPSETLPVDGAGQQARSHFEPTGPSVRGLVILTAPGMLSRQQPEGSFDEEQDAEHAGQDRDWTPENRGQEQDG
jgi:O-acetyl-ADP-ribose deacetylase (regulator of RNase III)